MSQYQYYEPGPYAVPSSANCSYGYNDSPLLSPPYSSPGRQQEYMSYFVPGYGISRQVIFNWYQCLLGPSATIRPFSYQGREGYLLTNPGKPLTKNQIEDLKRLSLEYEEKEAVRMISRSGGSSRGDFYLNQPVPVQQRRQYVSDAGSEY